METEASEGSVIAVQGLLLSRQEAIIACSGMYVVCWHGMFYLAALHGVARSDDFDLPSGKQQWSFRKSVIFLDGRQ